jgi:hypothetical protein
VVSRSELQEAAAPVVPPRSNGVGGALFTLMLLLLAAAAVYGFFYFGPADRIGLRPAEQSAPEAAPAPPTATPAAPASETTDGMEAPLEVNWGDETPAESGMKDGRVVWDNADFRRGATLFNEALAWYEGFQKTRQNPAILTKVEAHAREAIKAFEACKRAGPARCRRAASTSTTATT